MRSCSIDACQRGDDEIVRNRHLLGINLFINFALFIDVERL